MKYSIFKKETWVSVSGVFLAILILIILLPFSAGNSSKTKSYEGYTVGVDYGKGIQKRFWGSSKMGKTAWDTLQQASAHSFLNVDVGEDFYPKSIDQIENSNEGKEWTLYINSERIFGSPIEIKINSGDEVLWKFE